jgi:hypothetical protein
LEVALATVTAPAVVATGARPLVEPNWNILSGLGVKVILAAGVPAVAVTPKFLLGAGVVPTAVYPKLMQLVLLSGN